MRARREDVRRDDMLPPLRQILDVRTHVGPAVYFVHASQLSQVKIGYSESIARRLDNLNTASADPLRLLFAFAVDGVDDERAFHERFRAYRTHREWFTVEGELASFIIDRLYTCGGSAAVSATRELSSQAEANKVWLKADEASKHLLLKLGIPFSQGAIAAAARAGEGLECALLGNRRRIEVGSLEAWAAKKIEASRVTGTIRPNWRSKRL